MLALQHTHAAESLADAVLLEPGAAAAAAVVADAAAAAVAAADADADAAAAWHIRRRAMAAPVALGVAAMQAL